MYTVYKYVQRVYRDGTEGMFRYGNVCVCCVCRGEG